MEQDLFFNPGAHVRPIVEHLLDKYPGETNRAHTFSSFRFASPLPSSALELLEGGVYVTLVKCLFA